MRIYLSKFDREAFGELYELRCEKKNIYWTNNLKKPDRLSFYCWCEEQLKRVDRKIFLLRDLHRDNPIGYGYIDLLKEEEKSVELSYAISSKFMDRGLGTELVSLMIEYCIESYDEINKICAWVLSDNVASKRVLIKNNFKETTITRLLYFKPLDRVLDMIKFEYFIG